MLKKLRFWLITQIIELNEKFIFNRKLLKFYQKKLSGKIHTVIDVGANTGQSIDLFLKLNPDCKIFAIEPNQKLFEGLRRKYSNNHNVQLFQMGISDVVGEKVFHENVLHNASTFEEFDPDSKYLQKKSNILGVRPDEIFKESYPVKVTTLSRFIEKHCKEPIEVLKIDTEGHEYACLTGLFNENQKPPIGYIQVEMHYNDMYINKNSITKLAKILKDHGFETETKISHGFGNFDDVIFKNEDKPFIT